MNKLTFLRVADTKSADGHIKWVCQCECGNISEYIATRVRLNRVSQCRSCATNVTTQKITIHGMKGSLAYNSWQSIKARCLNESCRDFERYGEKGISICNEWKDDFLSFFSYVGAPPSKAHTIDRIDNDKGYEPGNVRWATRSQQQRNKTCSVYVTNGNEVLHINEVAKRLGISRGAAHLRLKRGKLDGYTRNN